MSYADGYDIVKRYDVDVIGMLANDDREELDRAAVPIHPNVLTALDDASGEIDAKLTAGGRYKPEQLATLTGSSLAHLKRITCAVAMALLFERRVIPSLQELAEKIAKQSRDLLTQLAEGKNVFGLPELTSGQAATMRLETVETIDIQNQNLITERMGPYFPRTAQRMPRH